MFIYTFNLIFIAPILIQVVRSQSSGTITISTPGSSGCIIVAQAATLGTPYVLTQMTSVCPDDGEKSIKWPLTTSGDGSSSDMVFYAQLSPDRTGTTAAPGCVLTLTQMQAMYCLGRNLEWRSDVNEIYDNTAGGYLVDSSSYQPVKCGQDPRFMPERLMLPAPDSGDMTEPVTLTVDTGAAATLTSSGIIADSPAVDPQITPESTQAPVTQTLSTGAGYSASLIPTDDHPIPETSITGTEIRQSSLPQSPSSSPAAPTWNVPQESESSVDSIDVSSTISNTFTTTSESRLDHSPDNGVDTPPESPTQTDPPPPSQSLGTNTWKAPPPMTDAQSPSPSTSTDANETYGTVSPLDSSMQVNDSPKATSSIPTETTSCRPRPLNAIAATTDHQPWATTKSSEATTSHRHHGDHFPHFPISDFPWGNLLRPQPTDGTDSHGGNTEDGSDDPDDELDFSVLDEATDLDDECDCEDDGPDTESFPPTTSETQNGQPTSFPESDTTSGSAITTVGGPPESSSTSDIEPPSTATTSTTTETVTQGQPDPNSTSSGDDSSLGSPTSSPIEKDPGRPTTSTEDQGMSTATPPGPDPGPTPQSATTTEQTTTSPGADSGPEATLATTGDSPTTTPMQTTADTTNDSPPSSPSSPSSDLVFTDGSSTIGQFKPTGSVPGPGLIDEILGDVGGFVLNQPTKTTRAHHHQSSTPSRTNDAPGKNGDHDVTTPGDDDDRLFGSDLGDKFDTSESREQGDGDGAAKEDGDKGHSETVTAGHADDGTQDGARQGARNPSDHTEDMADVVGIGDTSDTTRGDKSTRNRVVRSRSRGRKRSTHNVVPPKRDSTSSDSAAESMSSSSIVSTTGVDASVANLFGWGGPGGGGGGRGGWPGWGWGGWGPPYSPPASGYDSGNGGNGNGGSIETGDGGENGSGAGDGAGDGTGRGPGTGTGTSGGEGTGSGNTGNGDDGTGTGAENGSGSVGGNGGGGNGTGGNGVPTKKPCNKRRSRDRRGRRATRQSCFRPV